MSIRIQVIDRKEVNHSGLVALCEGLGYRIFFSPSVRSALKCIKKEEPDFIFLAFDPPDLNGMEVLKKVKKTREDLLVFSLVNSPEQGLETMKAGAEYYFLKPYNPEEVEIVLKKHLAIKGLQGLIEQSRCLHLESLEKNGVVSASKTLRELCRHALKFAEEGNVPVLIGGEVGTEKELLARIIHVNSYHFPFPFVSINGKGGGSLPLEASLSTVQKGSGGQKGREGPFQKGEGGTIFLYNIEHLPRSEQLRLLGYLKHLGAKRRSGKRWGLNGRRIIGATTIDLKMLVDKGRFNKELYLHLSKRYLVIPPLRKRREEIIPLATCLLKSLNREYNKNVEKIDGEVCSYLESYEWPGNVSELRNFVERAVMLTTSERITMKEVEGNISKKQITLDELLMNGNFLSLDEMVSLYVKTVIKKVKGNKSKAAKILKVSRNTLKKKSIPF